MTAEDTKNPTTPPPPGLGEERADDSCEQYRERIEVLLFEQRLPATDTSTRSGTPGPSALDQDLDRHLGGCSQCSELLALHAELLAWEDSQPLPSEHEEARVRRNVLAEIGREAPRRLQVPLHWQRLAAAAAVIVAMAAAFLGGRLTNAPGAFADDPGRLDPGRLGPVRIASDPTTTAVATRADLASSLLDPIAASLRSPASGSDVDRGPYSFDDVQLHDLGNDRVRLSFDYSIHLEVERERSDPLVTEVLVHAILDGGSLGTQLKAIGTADEPELSPRLRAALIRTMLEDESAPARQAALQRLLPDAALSDVESALLHVLEHEPSVHMRLLAIDALAAGGVSTGRLEEALEAGPAEPGQALRLRVGDLRQQM